MKTLIFMASPNKKGNTQAMLEAFLKELRGETYIINCYDVNVKPCIGCKICYTCEGKCSINDDMTYIYEKINESDNIAIFSPMYFASYPGTLKNIIDRMQVYWSKKYILNSNQTISKKKGVLFLNAGSEWRDMFKPMQNMFKYIMKSIGGEVIGGVYISNTDKFPVRENEEAFERIYEVVRKL
ncbi:flavodoxin family protein [Clostridium aestuarii]|uniref:Flavodoxin family protein n=1 Tax=Clostridium aestuarii TaxID=338193 RepID=A0ABT4D0C4_9CLOT|nr:flavodoxin family protein [Clostridium aestuarii]MCY6484681.1 flavodoxin family protein [Clostridium aestuarii]